MFDNKNKPKGLKRVYLATLNSIRAFKWLIKNEAAFRQELLLLSIASPATFLFDITVSEQLILILAILFILLTEILNTAIEAIVDRVSFEIHPLSGLAKDLGSAAVLISVVIAVCLWLAVLL
ncbi:diacylglycerol kinase [Paraglaciecola aquimarina]|uniref:Diacylglycerol kinase n=1 Tax=Paraglaciecola aquimarina TaxID=1235557 RepID=A0ABU3SRQ8_9ALTE|nr:diacylglycerol kinase [Paraglaciecola aquimarina]MDU0352696.1 diacylglycerol kinase [Paraglaciecola aquimarina]